MNWRSSTHAAAEFWKLAGRKEAFPRSLEPAVYWALPLAVVRLPRLRLSSINQWLANRDVLALPEHGDRELEALLIASGGQGLVFLDGADPLERQRFALAHETSHFLVDYEYPRRRAVNQLGPQILEVLDGLRAATPSEQLTGVLRGVPLGVYTHLMERTADGGVASRKALEAEDRADRLALELLAPVTEVVTRLEKAGVQWSSPRAVVAARDLLMSDFGLPVEPAEYYSRMIVMGRSAPRSFAAWMRKGSVELRGDDGNR